MSTRGLLICVMGVDGSGKSTAVRRVVSGLTAEGADVGYVWNRWEPLFLGPVLRARRGSGGGAPASDAADYGAKRRLLANPVIAATWLAVASLDYAVRGIPRVRAAMSRHSIVLCDRYTPDFIVDQSMNLGGGPGSLTSASRALFLRLFPVPDALILFDLDAATAAARKDDVPDARTATSKRALYEEYGRQRRAIIIDASRSQDEVAELLATAVSSITEGLVR